MGYGFGMICVCFHDINTIAIYTTTGHRLPDLDLEGQLKATTSAVPVDPYMIVVAGSNGLALVCIETSQIIQTYSEAHLCDVNLSGKSIYALCCEDGSLWTITTKTGNWANIHVHVVDTGLGQISNVSTLVATPTSFYICDYDSSIYELSHYGFKKDTIGVPIKWPFLCVASDAGTLLCVSGGEENENCLIIKGGKSGFHHKQVKGAIATCRVFDVVFESREAMWILVSQSMDPGRVELRRYVLHAS